MAFPVDEQVPVVVPESATAGDVALARQFIAELSDRYGVPLRMGAARVLPRLVRQYLAANQAAPPAKDEAISCAPGRMRW